MSKILKRIGMIAIALVIAICPMFAFTGCKDKSKTPVSVSVEEGKTQFEEVLKQYETVTTNEYGRTEIIRKNLKNFSGSMTATGEDIDETTFAKVKRTDKSEFKFITSANDRIYVENMTVAGEDALKVYYAEDGVGYSYFRDSGETEKVKFSNFAQFKTAVATELYDTMIVECFLDENIDTLEYKSCTKLDNVYTLTVYIRTTEYSANRAVINEQDITISFDSTTKDILKVNMKEDNMEITTTEGNIRNSVKTSNEYEIVFNYGDVNVSVPAEAKNAQVSNTL